MKTISYYFLWVVLILCASCQLKLIPNTENEEGGKVEILRYDRVESLYLTTGDFSALQQMETNYPMETRTLIENILKLGSMDTPEINNKFLAFFQDSTLQVIISDAEAQYANMDDINRDLKSAFEKLKQNVPGIPTPRFYAQITALDQSIVVGDGSVGISLDKYLGEDYPLYKKYYSAQQRQSMTRNHIVPDCICFYLLSIYRMSNFEDHSQLERDLHMGKVMWVSNLATGKQFFQTKYTKMIDNYMKKNPKYTVEQLLKLDDYTKITE
ncbi:MAG: gliding motility protein GldB [Prevotellaceae bacterium]|nr:gliding motility protein GldB [Prevotella sp.]MDD7257016.1 gliding motility protein GldB [Prevotellaceae bacterium]MDY6130214.1 gliding motility protein GldB [Prevotella sp.]